ncbi:hypothetical protein WL28_22775 [Burkholderia ubonensis]|uniref:phosphoribosyltransferase-like protein n=1 Tax=Burkholderia TaxID=32008 RepID=UPI00068DAEA8|nr:MULTISPECIES: hypothetical protein [Burkholderia]KWA67786.1 hypothetical protein WL28_22775 [Burkholderia ubonensis]KWC21894.1 hypothetical protein WL48_33240 [Burkholderia ubonensis]KWC25631.1 hypothetical protein WL49_03390 [Burkholderia ubonensis]KWN71253.1 hypothetical protein WM23_31145 [Burkholderia ubonensis]
MSERDDLLAAVANTISSYRTAEIVVPTPAHVDTWLNQFTPASQLPFLREFAHVIAQRYLSRAGVTTFLEGLAGNAALVGQDPVDFWRKANVLQIQANGQSQNEMVALLADVLMRRYGVAGHECGREKNVFIYLDDILFTGNRVATDLEAWIRNAAPNAATLHIVLVAFHTSGQYYLSTNRLKKAVDASGKAIKINYWRAVELENRNAYRDRSDVLWPAVLPGAPEVQQYLPKQGRFPIELRPPGNQQQSIFSSEAGRQVLESEFLIAGAKILAKTTNPKEVIRPLGFGMFGLGFGSTVVTYRNCPNNCPLALWWGEPGSCNPAMQWYPLLPRKTYGPFQQAPVRYFA